MMEMGFLGLATRHQPKPIADNSTEKENQKVSKTDSLYTLGGKGDLLLLTFLKASNLTKKVSIDTWIDVKNRNKKLRKNTQRIAIKRTCKCII